MFYRHKGRKTTKAKAIKRRSEAAVLKNGKA
jgi:hypothetical protein